MSERAASIERELGALVSRRYGLAIGEREQGVIRQLLAARAPGQEAGAALVEQLRRTPDGEGAWGDLLEMLTVGESYFFRDSGQFAVIGDWLLPRLERQGKVHVWSAGCADGQEPYSIAMLLDERLHRAAEQVAILGTDANPRAIERARIGRYRNWSLRVLDPTRRHYFTRQGEWWELDGRIRRRVQFRTENLLGSTGASAGSFDLILCRNLIIYLTRQAAQRLLDILTSALAPGGYLLTAHNELQGLELGELRPMVLPETVIYRRTPSPRVERAVAPPRRRPLRPPAPRPPAAPRPPPTRPASPEPELPHPSAFTRAWALADVGRTEEAVTLLQGRLREAPTDVEAGFLLGYLEQQRGNLDEAARLLERVLYLEPGHLAAYVELAGLFERQGRHRTAMRTREAVIERLRRLPGETAIAPYEGVTAAQLAAYLGEMARAQGSAE